jgi:drug/metabolite transporter (DMT)-like permease
MFNSSTSFTSTRQYRQRMLLLLCFAAVYIIWGSTYLAVRFAVASISPFLLSSFRFLTAGIILLVIAKFTKAAIPSKLEFKNAGIIGVLLLVTGNAGVIWAAQFTPSNITALIITIEPVWVVLLLWMKSKNNKPTPVIWAGIVVGLIGIVTLIGPSNLNQLEALNPIGIITIILSSISWAIGSIYSMQLQLPKSAFMNTGIQMLVASTMMFLIATLFGEWAYFDPSTITLVSFSAFMYLVVFGSIIGFTSYAYLVKHTTATAASTHAYVNPVIAVLLGLLIGKEIITSHTIFAAIFLISAVVLVIAKPKFEFFSKK